MVRPICLCLRRPRHETNFFSTLHSHEVIFGVTTEHQGAFIFSHSEHSSITLKFVSSAFYWWECQLSSVHLQRCVASFYFTSHPQLFITITHGWLPLVSPTPTLQFSSLSPGLPAQSAGGWTLVNFPRTTSINWGERSLRVNHKWDLILMFFETGSHSVAQTAL
jgi:hypothetical protein